MPEVVCVCVRTYSMYVMHCMCVLVTRLQQSLSRPSFLFYQPVLSNRYSHLCLSANMLRYPSLFPSPQRDKVKESCTSTSNSVQVCSQCFFSAPFKRCLINTTLYKRVNSGLLFYCIFSCALCYTHRIHHSVLVCLGGLLLSVTVSLHKTRELRSSELLQHFIFLFLSFLSQSRGEKRDTVTTQLVVLTAYQLPLPPSPAPFLPPHFSPRLLLWPISAEHWSVKKFPISKFTHCINLV